MLPKLLNVEKYAEVAPEIDRLQGKLRRLAPTKENLPKIEDVMRRLYNLAEEAAAEIQTPAPMPPASDIFQDFVPGENRAAFKLLEHTVNVMRTTGRSNHLCLIGPPSTGKTASAQRVALSLDRGFRMVDAQTLNGTPGLPGLLKALADPNLESPALGDLTAQMLWDSELDMMQAVLSPLVMLVDEAHMLCAQTQAQLLTVMESPYLTRMDRVMLNWSNIVIILATTDPSQLADPLRTRTLEIEFQRYSTDTLVEILVARTGVSRDVARSLAVGARGIPRKALAMARTLGNSSTPEGLQSLFGLDNDGMDSHDRRIIQILRSHTLTANPVKVQEAKNLIELAETGKKVSDVQLAKARALIQANGKALKPMSLRTLADQLGMTDTRDLQARVNELALRGIVTKNSQGITLNQTV